jgi:ParB family chromosome partitioning protein
MKRRDVVRALLTPQALPPDAPPDPAPSPPAARVPAHAVRALGLEIGRLAEDAREADSLRRQIAEGGAVVELDPELIDPSFAADRLAATEDADYRRLVASMRAAGQLAPILVRPHPDRPGRYQIAYGHRRRAAAAELGIRVRAIVRPLSDAELVVAQGKENAERRNLSFIERALFAAGLAAAGFDRATLNAALGVHTAEMTRLLAVAAAVPAALARAIGPAPKAGRPRWLALAALLDRPGAAEAAMRLLQSPSLRRLSSDRRFEAVLASLRAGAAVLSAQVIHDADGRPLLRVEQAGQRLVLSVDLRRAPGLGAFLCERLPELVRSYEQSAASD